MTNRAARNNSYVSYISELDQIYVDPSEEQSDIYFQAGDGQQPQNDQSPDPIFQEKHEHDNGKQIKYKSPSKNISFTSQDSDVNSLGYLTKQFMRLLQETKPNDCVDISEAAKTLNVQKRRIYDITNVLEGIGYIEKVGKNLMRWVGGTKDKMQGQLLQVERKIEEYENRERYLDAQIQAMNTKIHELSSVQNYFKMDDLYQIMLRLKCTHMIVYNGYEGVEISVSENTQSGKKEISIESPPTSTKLGSVYVISNPQNESQDMYVVPVISEICKDEDKQQEKLSACDDSQSVKDQEDEDESKEKQSNDIKLEGSDESQDESSDDIILEGSDESKEKQSNDIKLEGSDESQDESSDDIILEGSDESKYEQSDDIKVEGQENSLRQHQQKESTLQCQQKRIPKQNLNAQKQPVLKSQTSVKQVTLNQSDQRKQNQKGSHKKRGRKDNPVNLNVKPEISAQDSPVASATE